jgi:hemolysin activation/secretion protein
VRVFIALLTLCLFSTHGLAQKKLLAKADSLLSSGLSFLPIPILYNSPETSWGAGLSTGYYFRLGDSLARHSNLQAQAVYTLRRQFITRLSADLFGPAESWYAYGYLSYRNYTDRFYGIGAQRSLADRLDFNFSSWEARAGWLWQLFPNQFIGPLVRHQYLYNLSPADAGTWDALELTGGQGYSTTGWGLEYRFDTRNNVQSTQSGWFLRAWYRHHPAWHGSTPAFGHAAVDLRHFHHFRPEWVWANRILAQHQNGQPPFRELAMAGGSDFARGFFEGRFRDKNLTGWDSELRWQAHRLVGINAFTSVFTVAPAFQKLSTQHLQAAYGLGLRLFVNPRERIALRIDVARNTEGQYGFYIDLSEAF